MALQPRTSLLTRIVHALKAASMRFPGWGGQIGAPWGPNSNLWPTYQPNSRFDWQAMAGDLWRNEVVSICLGWIADNYVQPEFQVQEKKGEVYEPIPDHPLVKLLLKPNPFYGPSALWQAVVTSEAVSGNAYLMKARPENDQWGQPLELWYLPHWQVFPQWPSNGSKFIDHYIYRVPDRDPQRLEVADVIHFRRGLNLFNMRSGEAPLESLLRSVCTDTEATGYTAAVLANSGVFNVAISAGAADVTIPEEEAQKLQQTFASRFGGDNRGRALVCTRAMKIEPIQWSPEQLALDRLPLRAEARLCAALRVPPMVVGLNVGDDQRTYSNMSEARQMAYEDCLMPLQSRHCETLDQQLLPDFGDPETQCCKYDYENVRALAEDEDAKTARAVSQFSSGLITRAEARAKLGFESDKDDEVYYVPKGGQLQPADAVSATALTQQNEQDQQRAALGQSAAFGLGPSAFGADSERRGPNAEGRLNGNGNQYAGAGR